MRPGRCVLLVFLGACGEVTDPNKLPDAPLADGGADAPIDAPIDAPPPRCDPAKPFGAPTPVTELNSTAQDIGPWLTADERTIYFASTRPGGMGSFDIYTATRATPTSTWEAPSLVAGVNSANSEMRPTLTADGLTMYAERETNGGPTRDIVTATRSATNASFSALTAVTVLNDGDIDATPYVLPDHSALYMTSRRGGSNNIQVYRAARSGGVFSAPALVSGAMLDVFDEHLTLAITPDELTLHFTSNRSGGTGGYDVWVATRASQAVGFSMPTQVTTVNDANTDSVYWVSDDTCVMYMTKVVSLAAAFNRIFVATKPL
ncbi:MAG: TolB family protein [Kofleriaceae bacterium]